MTNTEKRYEAETKRQAMFQRMKVYYEKNAMIDIVNIVYHVKYNRRWPGHLYWLSYWDILDGCAILTDERAVSAADTVSLVVLLQNLTVLLTGERAVHIK